MVEVPPERIARWIENFAARHEGVPKVEARAGALVLTAPDGAVAECRLPFGDAGADVAGLVAAATARRRIGLLLARRGAYGVGIADGPSLVSSKVDRQYVQGRTAAGGWSQHRFARRRDNQARQSAQAAADTAARLLLPERARLAAVVLGGDRKAVDLVLSDRRLEPLRDRVGGWFLDVTEPRRAVLEEAARQARTVRITLTD